MRKKMLGTVLLFAGFCGVPGIHEVLAANRYWAGGSGLWQASNWTSTPGGSTFFGPPSAGDSGTITASSNITITRNSASAGYASYLQNLDLDGQADRTVTLEQTANNSSTGLGLDANNMSIGVDGRGVYNNVGGTMAASTLFVGENVGSSGTLAISGGTVTLGYSTWIGYNGTGYLSLTGGTLLAYNTFSGGGMRVGGGPGSGHYQQTGGNAAFHTFDISPSNGATGVVNQSGGTLSVATSTFMSDAGAQMNVSGTAFFASKSLTVSDGAILNQSGGTVGLISDLLIDNGQLTRTGGQWLSSDLLTQFITVRNGGQYDVTALSETRTYTSDSILLESRGSYRLGTSTLRLSGSSLTINGGELQCGTIELPIFLTPSVLNFLSGTLSLTASGVSVRNDGLLGQTVDLNSDKALNVSGLVTIHPGSRISLDGGTLIAGSLTNNGVFQFNSGLFRLTGQALTVGTLGQLGSTLQLDADQRIDVTHTTGLTIQSGGLLNMAGGSITLASTSTSSNNGEIILSSAASRLNVGTLNNSGTISGTGRIAGNVVNFASSGYMRVNAADAMQVGTFTNHGTLQLLGGTMQTTTLFTNGAAGRINGRGSILAGSGLVNNGSITLSGGPTDIYGLFTNASGGTVLITGGSNTTFYGPVTLQAGSSMKVGTASIVTFLAPMTGTNTFNPASTGIKIFESTAAPGALATGGSTIVESGGALVTPSIRESSLSVYGTATIEPNGTTTGTSRLNMLTIDSGGTLDLNDNDLVIDYTTTSPIDDIRGYLSSGALFSSTANASVTPKFAIGYIENTTGLPIFSGQPADTASLLIAYTLRGDGNLDGKVNTLDFNQLAGSFGLSNQYWIDGDYNYSGTVDSTDFNQFVANYGNSTIVGAAPTLGAVVPEPVLVTFAGMGVFACRRHRKPVIMVGMAAKLRE